MLMDCLRSLISAQSVFFISNIAITVHCQTWNSSRARHWLIRVSYILYYNPTPNTSNHCGSKPIKLEIHTRPDTLIFCAAMPIQPILRHSIVFILKFCNLCSNNKLEIRSDLTPILFGSNMKRPLLCCRPTGNPSRSTVWALRSPSSARKTSSVAGGQMDPSLKRSSPYTTVETYRSCRGVGKITFINYFENKIDAAFFWFVNK